jgi:hypothetical protein
MTKRFHWNVNERFDIACHVAKTLSEQPGTPRVAAMRLAVEAVIQPSRQKTTTLMSAPTWLDPLLPAARKHNAAVAAKQAKAAAKLNGANGHASHVQAVEPPAPAETPAEAPIAAAVPALPEPPTAVVVAPPPPTADLWQLLRARLVDEVASVVAEGALKAVTMVIRQMQPAAEPEPPDPSTVRGNIELMRRELARANPAAPRKPSVLVVGLKGSNKSEIEAGFGRTFDLRFIDSEQSKDQLRLMAEKADTTVVMTDFISHSHTDIVKSRAPKYHLQSGGMTSLRATLMTLGQERAAA